MSNCVKQSEKQDPCKKYACEFQYCLQKHNYLEEKCVDVLNRIKKCCEENYDMRSSNSNAEISATCSGFMK